MNNKLNGTAKNNYSKMKFLSLFTNVELLYYESCLESQIGGVQVI